MSQTMQITLCELEDPHFSYTRSDSETFRFKPTTPAFLAKLSMIGFDLSSSSPSTSPCTMKVKKTGVQICQLCNVLMRENEKIGSLADPHSLPRGSAVVERPVARRSLYTASRTLYLYALMRGETYQD